LNNNNVDNNHISNKINELEKKIQSFDLTNMNNNSINDFKNLKDNLDKKELSINSNKSKIEELNNKISKLYEEFYKNKPEDNKDNALTYENEIDNIKNEIDNIYNEIDNNINPDIKELFDKIAANDDNINYIQNKIATIESKVKLTKALKLNDDIRDNSENINKYSINIEEFKKEINSKINQINETLKDNTQDINNKILNIRADSLKIFDSKNDIIEKQLKSINEQILNFDNKINQLTNDTINNNITNIDNKESNNDNDKDKDDNENKIKEIEEDIKSYDLRIIDIENKIKRIYSIIDNNKKLHDSLSIKTITTSNSNGFFYQKVKTPLYQSTIPRTPSSSKSKDNKKYSNYYLSNNSSSLNKDIKKVFDLKIDTNILKIEGLSDDFFLFSKLKEIYPYNKYIKLVLVYRATRDGDLSKDFHSRCDFIGPNLTLVKTKKGYIFGGFTTKNWKHLFKDIDKFDPDISTEYIDDKAFCFSLNKKKIYENKYPNENIIIYCNNNYGICFTDFFYVYDECFRNGGMCGKNANNKFEGLNKQYEYNGGQSSFFVEEIEVFQIGFK
jgi:predicted  nucleic acid-binding Zn-ribbon protein